MKRLHNFFCAFFLAVGAGAASLPFGWQFEQTFDLSTAGLAKISLPATTLGSARPALEDLRLDDDAGNEIPYVIESPAPTPPIIQPPQSFHVSINEKNTLVTIETGISQPIDALQLESPAGDFIKAVRVECSANGKTWDTVAQGKPVFRQNDGVANLKIGFAPTISKWLRLTVDDARSPPVPWTSAWLFSSAKESAPVETFPVAMSERDENTGETRLALDLGTANQDVVAVHLETSEPLFMRQVIFAVPQIVEDAVHEQTIGQGTVYRVAVPGQSASENLSVPLQKSIRSRELILYIENRDSPPLPIKSVSITRRPVYFAFLARRPGTFHLLSGNAHCDPPHYDLAALNMDLKSVPVAAITLPPPVDNPDYRPPEVLAGIEPSGAPLDISQWQFRNAIHMSGEGAQQIELDPDVLAHANSGFADLRVMDGSNQVPYLIERTSINRAISPSVTATNDPKNPQLSRWLIRLPQSSLPITRLTCVSQTPLFDRQMSLYEQVTDDRGETFRRDLGGARWTQTPGDETKEFSLGLEQAPQMDALFLETENGDNPAISLDHFRCFYSATRILFKARAKDEFYLYYGNPNASSPQYDLTLVAGQLLAADKKTASLAGEQPLKKASWTENEVPGKGGILFWGILAVVVAVLLAVISRLLPKKPMDAD
jgi:Protein of unknown function (DUF3999)